jgi:hypothetical protein
MIYTLVMTGLLSCSRRSIAENTVTSCYFEGGTNSGKTLAVKWMAVEHRCWAEGGWSPDEGRPKNAEAHGQCGASLFQKELNILKTQTQSISSECTFAFDSESVTLSIENNREMRVSLTEHDHWVAACSTVVLKDDSDGSCSSPSSRIRLSSLYEDDRDIFYVGSCYSGLRQETGTFGTYDVYDSVRHYWTFDKESETAAVAEEQCLLKGNVWKPDEKKYLNHQQGDCIQSFEKGLVVTSGDSDFRNSFACEEPVEIFRISN